MYPLLQQGGGNLYSNIYVITNKINNKKYVGQSIDVEKRWSEHKYNSKRNTTIYLYNSMKKYGIDNFTLEVIEENIPLQMIDSRESYWIEKLNTYRPEGYNLTLGGEGTIGYVHTQKTKSAISKKAQERFNNLSDDEKTAFISRIRGSVGDLVKMNEGYRKWLITTPNEIKNEVRQRMTKTKKEKGYDFYNFSFGKMTLKEKKEMYEKISKNNPRNQSISMLNKDNELVMNFHSLREAARYLNKNYGYSVNSHNNIKKKLNSDTIVYGYKWVRNIEG